MTSPVVEQIADKMATRLAAITVAHGYNQNVNGVVRPDNEGEYSPDNYRIVMIQGDPQPVEDEEYVAGNPAAKTCWEVFHLLLFVRQSTKAAVPQPIDALTNMFWADAVKAIGTPAAGWDQWDGLAIGTEFGLREGFTHKDGAFSGLVLTVRVMVRTDDNNPYNVRV